TDADAGDETVGGHVPVALRDRGQSGEYGEDEHGPGQHLDTTVAIGESAEDDPAEHRAEQSDRRQGTSFDLAEAEGGDDSGQSEAEDEQVEAIEPVADGCGEQGPAPPAAIRGGIG